MSDHWWHDDERVVPRMQPPWLHRARDDLGACDLPEAPPAPLYALWLPQIATWWGDGAVPWSGRCVAHWLARAGCLPPLRPWFMRHWLDWGVHSVRPAVGAVAVARWQSGGAGCGFVGLLVDVDDAGRVLILAGRERQAVRIEPLEPRFVLAYRWPTERESHLPMYTLPTKAGDGD